MHYMHQQGSHHLIWRIGIQCALSEMWLHILTYVLYILEVDQQLVGFHWTEQLQLTSPIMCRTVSLTPIGQAPGHLSRAISRHVTKADVHVGSTYSQQSLLAVHAMESHKSADAVLKEQHMHFQGVASRPDSPAAPSILMTVLRISSPSIASNTTGCGSM